MRRYPYSTVLEDIEALWHGNQGSQAQGELGIADQLTVRRFINRWASKLWEMFWWPEWLLVEERTFRNKWNSATAYSAPTATAPVEVFHVRSGKYAQALQASTGQEPFNAIGVENSTYWAASASAYTGNDWATGIGYTVGTIVRNPADNRFYQCITAHTSGASFTSANFGILTAFQRSLDYEQSWETNPIGRVRSVWDLDPRVYYGAADPLEFDLREKIYVSGDEAVVWVEFLKRNPEWTGAAYSAATTYAEDDQAYDSTRGDFYKSLSAGNVGNAVTNTAFWERIDFPHVLRLPVAQAAYAELLRSDGQNDKAADEEIRALRLANDEFTAVSRQQRQARRLPVRMP